MASTLTKSKRLGLWYNVMATIGEIEGLRVVIYSNDHRPAHVHVIGGGCEAVFKLNCPEGRPELRENYGFTKRRISQIKTALTLNLAHCCAEWSRIHGLP